MTNRIKVLAVILLSGFLIFGCSESSTTSPENAGVNTLQKAGANFNTFSNFNTFNTLSEAASCVTLFAGQTIDAGEVCVEVVDGDFCVTYTTDNGWELDEYHLWVGTGLDYPQTKNGSPKLGKFPYKGTSLSGASRNTVTVCISAEDLGLAELCEVSELNVVAHAVVKSDTDGDGILDASQTGFGDGFDLGGDSWAMGMNVPLCIEEFFDADGLAGDLADAAAGGKTDGRVGLQVSHQGGNSSQPYFRGQLDYNEDGNSELTGLPFYCVDLAHTISGNWYCAMMLSSYSETLPSEILHPENLDLANYVLNTYSIGDNIGNSANVTGGDIQRVLWKLVYGTLTNPGDFSSGSSSNDNVNQILSDAAANGESYTPPCDGVVAVILYPTSCDADGIAGQVLIGQVLVTEFPAACGTVCTTNCD